MLNRSMVFICYQHDHYFLASKIYDSLCVADIQTFWDEKSIRPGMDIVEELRKGLTQCDILVCLVSRKWLDSVFCRREINSIIMDGSKRIIPLLLEADLSLPYDLKPVKSIQFTDWQTNYHTRISELINALPYGVDFYQMQRSALLNSSVLPWIPQNEISFDYIWPELFVNTSIVLQKHIERTTIKEWAASYSFNCDVMIIGDPGAGKSSLLKYICLAKYESNNTAFFTAKELLEAWQATHSLREMLCFIYHDESLVIDTSSIQGIIVDGIDEANTERLQVLFDIFQHFRQHNIHILASSRSEYYYRHINANRVRASFFYELIRVEEWSVEQGKEYAKLYSCKAKDNSIYLRILDLVSNTEKIRMMIRNPFRASLLLFLFSDGLYSPTIDLSNVYALYDEFYKNWLIQEHSRNTSHLPRGSIITFHENVALKLYTSREGIHICTETFADDNTCNCQIQEIISDSGVMGLLQTDDRHEPIYVEKFKHETLSEYLIAKQLVDAFVNDSQKLPRLLQIIYGNSVNTFVRAYLDLLPERKKRAASANLGNLYEKLFTDDATYGKLVSEQIREQIIYYVGRIPLSYTPQVLAFAYRNESNSILKRSAALSLILEGNEYVEAEYLNLVLSDPAHDLENRSIQLVYFGDADDDFHTYRDVYNSSWERTKSVLIGRFKQSTTRERRLRLWDIITFKSFILSRGKSAVRQEEIDAIEHCVIEFDGDSAERKFFLYREKCELLKMLTQ